MNKQPSIDDLLAVLRYIRAMQEQQGMLNLARSKDLYYPQPIYMPPSTSGTRG